MGERSIKPKFNIYESYKKMNISNPYRFEVPAPVPSSANTFIGGVAASVPDKATLAANLAISESNISYFAVVGIDIEATIDVSYVLNDLALNFNGLTYYKDQEGKCTSLGTTYISVPDSCEEMFFPAVSYHGYAVGNGAYTNRTRIKTIYIPNATQIAANGHSEGNMFWTALQGTSDLRIYAHPSLETSNAGGEEGDLAKARSFGAKIRYVTNLTAPNPITDLAITTVYATALRLNFTEPTGSTNAIDYYEVYVDGKLNNKGKRGSVFAINLSPSISYNIEVKPVDIFYNKSSSNIVAQLTNASEPYPIGNILAYFQMENNLFDNVGYHDAVGTDVTYTSGLVGQVGVFNGTTSKATAPNIAQTTKMSVRMNIKLANHIPIAAKTGLLSMNTESANTHYPFSDGKIYMAILTGTRKTIGAGVIADRTVNHSITITANTVTDVWKFYQNDQLVFTSTVGTLFISGTLLFGKGLGAYQTDGQIDNLIFFNTELTASQNTAINAKINAGQSLI